MQSTVRIPAPKKGSLTKYGYRLAKPEAERDVALKRAVKEYGPTTTIRKLNVVGIYNKNRNPTITKKVRTDMAFVRKLKK